MTEADLKIARLRALLSENSLDAVLLHRADNFAWATCGASSYVNQADTHGAAWLLVTATQLHLITDNIELPRFEREEGLASQGWELHAAPWYESNHLLKDLTSGLKVASDGSWPGSADFSSSLSSLRSTLTAEEMDRFRLVGSACAGAMNDALRSVRPGMSEHEIAAQLDRRVRERGVQPIVNLVAADERIYLYRHPLPTDKRLAQYAMLVLCGRQWGLVCSITRLVHFGRLPDELRRKAEAVASVDARLIDATRPGALLRQVFQTGVDAYRDAGFADEWKLHHQGGLAGYAPREIIATPTCAGRVEVGQAYAWNPSITGTKSEDTILVGENGYELITAIPGWPSLAVDVAGTRIERPAILELT